MSEKRRPELEGVDRGWSWVIAFACCFGSLVLAGIFRTSGVLFVAFISTYGVSREAASWPMVVCIAVLNLTGPFSGMLGQKFGVRPTVITGALIATIGISSCYFTTSLNLITVLFGGVFGIGYGFINTLMPVILNAYFLNLRATANGIANSGSCIGSIILPIVFEHLIAAYGLSGCFLLTGSIVLHLTIAGALMRPPPWKHNKKLQRNKQNVLVEYKYVPNKQTSSDVATSGLSNQKNENRVVEEKPCGALCNDLERTEGECLINQEGGNAKVVSSSSDVASKTKNLNSDHGDESISRRISCVFKESTTNVMPSSVFESFRYVLTCPMFYVTAVTNVSFYFLYHMYVVIIVDYALDREVLDVDAKNILFAFAISDLFGRLCLGWITDRKFISRSRFVMLCMLMIGLVFFAFPYATGYASLIITSCLYGLLLGCTMVVFPILLVDYCGIELHPVAQGCMCFMNGFASFGRPSLIGYFRDSIGSYSSMFYILGSLSVASSAFWLLETCFVKKRDLQTQVPV